MPEREPGGLRERLIEPAAGEIERLYRVRRRRARGRLERIALACGRRASLLLLWARYQAAVARKAIARAADTGPLLGGWTGDLGFALRQSRRRPRAWASAAIVLGLAIGSVTTVFSVVHAVLIAPLPFPQPDRLVRVMELSRGRPAALSVANWQSFVERNESLAQIGVWVPTDAVLEEGEPERLTAVRASAGLFEALGVASELGRCFEAAEDRAGGEPVVVLGHELWRRRFGGDPGVLGRRVSIDGARHTVVGVMPRGFDFPEATAAWLPLALEPRALDPEQRGAHYLRAVGRLRDGASPEAAARELGRLAAALRAEYPRSNEGYDATAVPLHRYSVHEVRAGLLWLWGAVACVLLLACADVAALQLAAGASRREELAVRAALGARPLRLFRQLATEALVLALAGGALGLLLTRVALASLPVLLPADLPRAGAVGLQLPVLVFALAATLLSALGFGTAPALQARRAAAADALGARGAVGGGLRTHTRLVALQAAGATLLLVGALLSLRSLQQLGAVDPGFRPEEVVSYSVGLPPARYATPADVAAVTRRLVERARALPGVVQATSASIPPLSPAGYHSSFGIEGLERAPGDEEPHASIRAVSPDYFDTLGIPIHEGRDFRPSDTAAAAGVAIVSRAVARRWWPDASPLGRRLRVHAGVAGREEYREVIGVVGDVRLRALTDAPPPAIYLPQSQYPWDVPVVMVRTAPGHRLQPAALAATARSVDPLLATWDAAPLTALVETNLAESRFRARLLAGFALAALLLAGLGLHGMLALAVGLRRRELGVRAALGARHADLGWLIAAGALVPVGLGSALGMAGAAALAPVLRSSLYGVAPLDPVCFLLAPALLVATAAVAGLVPARRAARLDPITALRHD